MCIIEDQISFTHFIKNEILEFEWSDKELGILFFAFLRTAGTFKKSKYVFTTTLFNWEDKINEMFKHYYGLNIEATKSKTQLKWEITDVEFLENFANDIGNLVVESSDENKAYVAGSFLGKGWISRPSSRFYHFEIRVRHLAHSLDIQEAIDGLGIRTATLQKNGWYYTYVKKALDISMLISAFNASQSVMYFEDQRIERDFFASYKKMEAIENYNLQKTHDTCQKQIECINKIKNTPLMNALSAREKSIMKLREEFPEFSLSELQMEYNNRNDMDVSKSTINNWLNKIVSISELKRSDK